MREEIEDHEEQERTRVKKELLLAALDENRGVVTIATSITGVHRTTYYAWYNSDPEFKKKVDFLRSKKIEILEDALVASAASGNIPALKLALFAWHPDFKRKRGKEEKHIHFHHHRDPNPGKGRPATLEDLIDHFEAQEALADMEEAAGAAFEEVRGPVPVELPMPHDTTPPIEEKQQALKKLTPRERRQEARRKRGKMSDLSDLDKSGHTPTMPS